LWQIVTIKITLQRIRHSRNELNNHKDAWKSDQENAFLYEHLNFLIKIADYAFVLARGRMRARERKKREQVLAFVYEIDANINRELFVAAQILA